jgi:hypothetical protein
MEKSEIEKIKNMLKILPNDFPAGIEDLYEIYSQEPKRETQ